MISNATGGAAAWHGLPQQDFFGQILGKLGRQDLAAVNLVSRSWHAGIHQQLTRLTVKPNGPLSSAIVDGLSGFPAMKSLGFKYGQPGLLNPQCRLLSVLPGLRQELAGMQLGLDFDLFHLTPLTGLMELSLDYTGAVHERVKLLGLALMPSLERLSVSVNHDIASLPLSRPSALQSLTLRSPAKVGVQFMGSLQQLTGLVLAANAIPDPMHLSHLTALVSLNIDCPHIVEFGWLSSLTKLCSLHLNTPLLHDLRPISQLFDMKDLWLAGQMTSLHDLAGLDLKELGLTACSQLTTLSGVQHMTRLRRLSLSECAETTSGGLSGLTCLTGLVVAQMPLVNMDTLSGLTNLRMIRVHGDPIAAQTDTLQAVVPWAHVHGGELQCLVSED